MSKCNLMQDKQISVSTKKPKQSKKQKTKQNKTHEEFTVKVELGISDCFPVDTVPCFLRSITEHALITLMRSFEFCSVTSKVM